jgi:UDP-N-acetylbacillosamine N-acetyltransferase
MKKLLILGAGGYGKTVADLAVQLGYYDKIAFLDDSQTGEHILGKCGVFAAFADGKTEMYPAFCNNTVRTQWLRSLLDAGVCVPELIHPRAYVSPTAKIGVGTVVLPMAVVNTGVTVKEGCIINIGVLIDHDSVIEEGCHLAPGAIVKAENRIRAGSKIESGIIIQNREYPL